MAGILFSHEEVTGMDTHCNTDRPQKHDAHQERTDAKGWIVCDYADEKCPEQAIHRNREWLSGCQGLEGGGTKKILVESTYFQLQDE